MILGLTGTIGSGKSTVARMIHELSGAPVIDADEIAHRVQLPGGPAFREILNEFGHEIVAPDGSIDRQKLGEIVFRDEAKLKRLNEIVHPKVRDEEIRLLEQLRARPLVVFMVPLLLENGLQAKVDRVAVVVTNDSVRRQRLKQRNGWSDSEIDRRLSAQWSDEEKMAFADFIIDNSGSLDETREQVRYMLVALGVQPAPGEKL
ncbi:MAG: dephospho-CoA kinase [Candidatus Sumerlaeaceae bacterium]|nr:dephospho-CoA kinase [Candidatus Sumerlaeaceae bacterium]